MPGTLFIVATPIGNLEDLTFRAKRVLGEVDVIAAEDTRRTGHLLAHYEIRKPMVSVREHNETRESARLVERLARGQSVAFVTDAGTPGIADPGARLVQAARKAGIPVVPIPGPSAVTALMSISGSPYPEFAFFGFPPPKGTERSEWFNRVATSKVPVVFFEAPHRIERTLTDTAVLLAEQQIIVSRELTKANESVVERPIHDLVGQIKPIGEFALLVFPRREPPPDDSDHAHLQSEALKLFDALSQSPAISQDLAIELVGLKLGLTPAESKKAVKKARILVKQQNR